MKNVPDAKTGFASAAAANAANRDIWGVPDQHVAVESRPKADTRVVWNPDTIVTISNTRGPDFVR